ncbi:MAG: glycoside hydrolase family 5 protein [Bacteroidia bacterium]|nr:glycoside hydrolase family 5 protein [Bacteroidia bacterium]
MKISHLLVCIWVACWGWSCQEEVPPTPLNEVPELTYLDLDLRGSVFNTRITDSTVTLTRALPGGTTQVWVKSITASPNNTLSLKAGDPLDPSAPVKITVTNQTSGRSRTYTLTSAYRPYTTPVAHHGRLRTSGNKVVDQHGDPVSLAGNSFFWSNNGWGGEKYYTPGAVAWLALDWDATIIRASMGVDDPGGYLDYPQANRDKVITLVDAAIEAGLYVIIDWHSHHAEDYQAEAVAFFAEMAARYGHHDHVIYEIYNEPLQISWAGTLKPYAEAVITAIRAADPDNLIIVGTPEWSQQVDKPAADPITISDNIAYTLHFYTVYHQHWLRDRATAALASGIPIFVTEWGSVGYTRTDPETDKWMDWCRQHQISHCNWAVNDKSEEWSILPTGANPGGNWPALTEAGYLAREIIRGW